MMLFSKSNRIKNRIELVSVHIPKTAGTSFRNFLKSHYGSENAVRFDINITTKRIDIENKEFSGTRLPNNIHVIHGHFYYMDLIKLVEIADDIPIITWLREPADRVISNFFYLEKRLKEELQEEKKGLNILSKMQKTLLEYARTDISRNRMSKFLHGCPPDRLFFTGLYEHYSEDMQYLAGMLGISDFKVFEHNITGTRQEVDPETMEEIRRLNQADYELYEQALERRNKRIKKPDPS